MIAHLGMYDPNVLRRHNDLFWQLIRQYLGYGPDHLTRTADFEAIWQNPDLLLSQTCGYPYRDHLHEMVRLVGTPDYGLPDCAPGHYFSVLVSHVNDKRRQLTDFDGTRFAYNQALSQSGWAAPISYMLERGVRPGALVQTGTHFASAQAVAAGRADLAGLDVVTFFLIRRHDPATASQLHALAHTPPTPGLPLITSATGDVLSLRRAVIAAIAALPAASREALHLRGLAQIAAQHYLNVPNPPSPAELMH